MSTLDPINGWKTDLPFNIKMKTQIGNGHSSVQSFYHPDLDEVIHMVFNNRRMYTNKWYVVVTDLENELHRTEKLYRRLLPNVEDEVVEIWSGSSGTCLFEEEVSPYEDTRQKAEQELLGYMKNNP